MKHLMIVGVLSAVMAGDVLAQGSEIYTKWGPSGSHVTLSHDTLAFNYEATITGVPCPYLIKLEVFHNGILKFVDEKPGGAPAAPFIYSVPVGMELWGLQPGDTVTFALKVVSQATGATLATHFLHGDIAGS